MIDLDEKLKRKLAGGGSPPIVAKKSIVSAGIPDFADADLEPTVDANNGATAKLPPVGGIKQEAGQKAKDDDAKAVAAVFENLGQVATNQFNKLVVMLNVGDRYGALSLESQAADDIIQAKAAEQGKSIGKDKRTAEKEKLRGRALLAGSKVTTFVRTAFMDGRYYLDLADGNMAVVHGGDWAIEKNTKVPFSFVGGQLPLPIKPDSVSAAYDSICVFLRRAGVPEHMLLIVTVVLIEWLRPNTAHPLLDIVGASGGGKTTLALMLLNLIDPATDWKIGETKMEESDLAAAANSRYALLVDNAGGAFSQDVQNLCCRVCYGTVVMQRKYYSQTEVEQTEVHAPVVVTSINPAITNADLLARTVRVPFKQRQGGYVSETDIRSQYLADRPVVLGALLELFAAALSLLPVVVSQRQWKHRLVDFAQMGEAVAQVVGQTPGTFVSALTSMRQGVAHDIVEGDTFTTALVSFLKSAGAGAMEAEKIPSYKSWATAPGWSVIRTGNVIRLAIKPAALLAQVKLKAGVGGYADKPCPESPRALTSLLMLKLPLLTDLGFRAVNEPDFGGKKNGAWIFAFKADDHA